MEIQESLAKQVYIDSTQAAYHNLYVGTIDVIDDILSKEVFKIKEAEDKDDNYSNDFNQ